jgi:hypothetical protein
MERILPVLKEQKEVKINEAFVNEEHYWIIDLHLDEYTLKLGNDPFYLACMYEDNLLVACAEVYNPDDLSDPLLLKTRLKIICKTDAETIDDIFYNVIDEITAYPLTMKALMNTQQDSIQNDTFDELINDIKEEGVQDIERKLKTALNVINPESKEGFIVNRLLAIYKLDPNMMEDVLLHLDIQPIQRDTKEIIRQSPSSTPQETPSTSTTESTQDTEDEAEDTQEVEDTQGEQTAIADVKPNINDKERESTINILTAQKKST